MNTVPRYTSIGRIGSVLVTAANTSSQGGGTVATDLFLALSAVAVYGTYVSLVRFIATGTTPTATTPTTGRVFISSVAAGATTSANTWLWQEITLPSVAADNATAKSNEFDVPLGWILPAGSNILVSNHVVPAANTGWRAVVIGGDYTP